MKILVVQESDWLKRGPHQQHHLMERLSLKGHIIRVIDYPIIWQQEHINSFFSKRTVYEDVSRFYPGSKVTVIKPAIIRLPFFDKLSILFTHQTEIKNQIKNFKPDIIVGLGILNNYIAIQEAKKAHIPFFYYLIDSLHLLLDNSIYQILAKEFEKNNIKNSTYVLTINKKLMEYVLELGGDKNKIFVIPAGIDKKFYHNPRKIDRSKYNLKDNDFILFFMGWLYSFSGILETAKAVIQNSDKNIKLLIVGEGDLYPSLVELSKISDKIVLTGKVPYNEIPSFLSLADVCILPAYNIEVMKNIVPIKIYEYLASGKPVICTKLPGLVTEFGKNSGIVFVASVDELISKTLLIKNDHCLRDDLSKMSKDIVKYQDWEQITTSFERILMNSMVE